MLLIERRRTICVEKYCSGQRYTRLRLQGDIPGGSCALFICTRRPWSDQDVLVGANIGHAQIFCARGPGIGRGEWPGRGRRGPGKGRSRFPTPAAKYDKAQVGCTIFQSTTMSASQLSEVRVDNWSHSAALYARFGSSDLCITDEIKIP